MALRDALERKVEITENGLKRKVPLVDVFFRQLVAASARCDRHATKHLLQSMGLYISRGVPPEDLKEQKFKGLDARAEIRLMLDQLAARRRAAEALSSSTGSGEEVSNV